MTDELVTTPPEEPEDSTTEVEPEGQTVEERDAFWKNRVSAEAKAHAAEKRQLREEAAAARAEAKTAAETLEASRRAGMSDLEIAQQEAREAKAELERVRSEATISTLKARFPDAAEALDDAVLASMPEEKLAALQSRLGGSPEPDRMETNGTARTISRKEPEDPLSDEAYRKLAEEAFPDSYHPR